MKAKKKAVKKAPKKKVSRPAAKKPTRAAKPAKKAAARKAKKTVAKKARAKKTVAKKAATKKTVAKKTVAKKAAAKKTVAKKAAAKKTVAKKAAAKKTVAKKAPPKKTAAKAAPVAKRVEKAAAPKPLSDADACQQRMRDARKPKGRLPFSPPSKRRLPPLHDKVAPELADDLARFVGKGYALLELDENAPPRTVVEKIHEFVDDVIHGRRTIADPDEENAPLALGVLLGQQFARELGWAWAHVRLDGWASIGVIDPEGRWIVTPLATVKDALARKPRGNTVLLGFNMLVAGNAPPSEAGKYLPLS